mgnify:CR=1 FL=1
MPLNCHQNIMSEKKKFDREYLLKAKQSAVKEMRDAEINMHRNDAVVKFCEYLLEHTEIKDGDSLR